MLCARCVEATRTILWGSSLRDSGVEFKPENFKLSRSFSLLMVQLGDRLKKKDSLFAGGAFKKLIL